MSFNGVSGTTTGAVGILVVLLADDPNIGVNAPITSISEIPEISTFEEPSPPIG